MAKAASHKQTQNDPISSLSSKLLNLRINHYFFQGKSVLSTKSVYYLLLTITINLLTKAYYMLTAKLTTYYQDYYWNLPLMLYDVYEITFPEMLNPQFTTCV